MKSFDHFNIMIYSLILLVIAVSFSAAGELYLFIYLNETTRFIADTLKYYKKKKKQVFFLVLSIFLKVL